MDWTIEGSEFESQEEERFCKLSSNMTIDGNSVGVMTSLWTGGSRDRSSNPRKRRDFVNYLAT